MGEEGKGEREEEGKERKREEKKKEGEPLNLSGSFLEQK